MLLKKKQEIVCLESFLSKDECWEMIKDNNMESLSTLCKRDAFPVEDFIKPNGRELTDVYATEKDWKDFLKSNKNLTDPSANAISHYFNNLNNRIVSSSVFFTDTTSGTRLLNPRFTYLVKKLDKELKSKYPTIHESLTVISDPPSAAQLEDYYTEDVKSYDFFLYLTYIVGKSVKERPIKIFPSMDTTVKDIASLQVSQKAVKPQPVDKSNYDTKIEVLEKTIDSIDLEIEKLEELVEDLKPYMQSIDSLILSRKILTKSLLEKINQFLPENLYAVVIPLLKEGALSVNGKKIKVSDKPIIGKSLEEVITSSIKSRYNQRDKYKDQLEELSKVSIEDTPEVDFTKFNSYINAICDGIQDIYKFVSIEPFKKKGSIPTSIITDFRNRNALLFVLCPNADDPHRCMYVASVGEDVRDLRYSFNAAGTKEDIYYIENGKLKVTKKKKGESMIKLKGSVEEAKARNVRKVKAALTGKNDLIKTWGIITAENPIGIEFPDNINKERDKELRSKLAQSNIEYIKVKGQYGSPENSLFIINPALSDLEKIASKFGQESFIFAQNNKEGDFSFDAGYYEMDIAESKKVKLQDNLKSDPEYQLPTDIKYKKSYTKKNIIDQKDADDFFTSISTHGRKFKFQIPFFEATIRRAYERVFLKTEGKDKERVQNDLRRTTIEADTYSPGSRWRIRGSLYHQE